MYDYKCYSCGLSFEVKKPMSDALSTELCPHCRQITDRVFTPVSFTFGWRLTDKSYEKYQPMELEQNV